MLVMKTDIDGISVRVVLDNVGTYHVQNKKGYMNTSGKTAEEALTAFRKAKNKKDDWTAKKIEKDSQSSLENNRRSYSSDRELERRFQISKEYYLNGNIW